MKSVAAVDSNGGIESFTAVDSNGGIINGGKTFFGYILSWL